MSDNPSLAFVIKQAIDDRMSEVYTSIPARVERVYHDKGLCDVQPVLQRTYTDGAVVNLPVVSNVPIAFYRAGKAYVSLPLKVGDYVNLTFSQRSLDVWLNKGGIVDPGDPRKFSLADAIAYPGVYPITEPLTEPSSENLIIRNDQSKIVLKPDGTIELVGSAIKALSDMIILSGQGDAVALASKVLTELNKIITAFNVHTHPYVNVATPSNTSPSLPPIDPSTDVGSSKVFAE